MTLLATEIHNHDAVDRAFIVFAADRRITRKSGEYGGTRKKIFALPWLNAGIGYFGLAEVLENRSSMPMQEWLQAFMLRSAGCRTMTEISDRLSSALNAAVPVTWRRTERSGFHIAGFNATGRPEFWWVRNVDDDGQPTLGEYQPREDFQRRDAPSLATGAAMIYRNGDIRVHATVWRSVDESFGSLLQVQGFRRLRNPEDYKNWVRFKMEMIAYFYKQYYPRPIIARPIDVILITPDR